MVQVLARRSKNNPILLGDPGVGKTAIAEGLARAIVTGGVSLALKIDPEIRCRRQGLGDSLVDGVKRSAEEAPAMPRKAVALPERSHGAQARCRTARRCQPSSGASA